MLIPQAFLSLVPLLIFPLLRLFSSRCTRFWGRDAKTAAMDWPVADVERV